MGKLVLRGRFPLTDKRGTVVPVVRDPKNGRDHAGRQRLVRRLIVGYDRSWVWKCVICGDEFRTPKLYPDLFRCRYRDYLPACSSCAIKRRNREAQKVRWAMLKASAGTCDHCGEPLPLTTRRRRFCSSRCRIAHHRQIQKAGSAVILLGEERQLGRRAHKTILATHDLFRVRKFW